MTWGTGQNKPSEMKDKKYKRGSKWRRGYREKVLPVELDFYKEGERMKEEVLFEEVMALNFLKLKKNTSTQIQGGLQTRSRINKKKSTSRYVVIQKQKVEDKLCYHFPSKPPISLHLYLCMYHSLLLRFHLSRCYLLFIGLYPIIPLLVPPTRFTIKIINRSLMSTILIPLFWLLLPLWSTCFLLGIVLGTHHTQSHLILLKLDRSSYRGRNWGHLAPPINIYSILPILCHLRHFFLQLQYFVCKAHLI